MRRIIYVFMLMALFLCQIGCVENYNFSSIEVEEINPVYGVPAIKTSISLYDLLKDSEASSFLELDSLGLIATLLFDEIDDLEFNLSIPSVPLPVFGEDDLIGIDTLRVTIVSDNGLPITIGIKAEFLDFWGDSQGYLLDNENDEILFESPTVNSSGVPTGTKRNVNSISIGKEKYALLSEAESTEYTITIRLPEGGESISIGPEYLLDIHIAIMAGVTIKPNLGGEEEEEDDFFD